MILGDQDLRYYLEKKKLIVDPIGEKTIRENGLDLSIGKEIAIEKNCYTSTDSEGRFSMENIIDSHNEKDVKDRFIINYCVPNIIIEKEISDTVKQYSIDYGHFIIEPHTLNLLTTQEYVKLSDDIMGFCSLRSTVARHGFIAPITIVDAGFEGTLTIEVFYGGKRPFKLYTGDRFLHLIIAKTNSPVKDMYNGVYRGQRGVRLPKCLD